MHGPLFRPRFVHEKTRQTGVGGSRVVSRVIVARRVVGAVLVLTGVVWIGQGTKLIQGSSMTGSTFWAVAGAVCFLAGLGLLGWPWRQSHTEP